MTGKKLCFLKIRSSIYRYSTLTLYMKEYSHEFSLSSNIEGSNTLKYRGWKRRHYKCILPGIRFDIVIRSSKQEASTLKWTFLTFIRGDMMLKNGFASGLIEVSREILAKFNLWQNFTRYSMFTSLHLQLITFAGVHIL